MKDSPVFNARFVSIIEKNPVLYDHTSEAYSDRDLQDKTWKKIANEVNQPVSECKERWKNLRGSYTRHLKYQNRGLGSATKKKKEYYLAKHLAFLLPFTKSREEKSNNIVTWLPDTDDNSDSEFYIKDEVSDSQFEELPEQTSGSIFPSLTYPKSSGDQDFSVYTTETSGSGVDDKVLKKYRLDSNKSRTTVDHVDKSTMETFESKASTSMTSNYQRWYDEDPDVLFLMSLLSDMKKMDDSQKRRFKIAILMTVGKILDEDHTSTDV